MYPRTGRERPQLLISALAAVALVATAWRWPAGTTEVRLFAKPSAVVAGAAARSPAASPVPAVPAEALPVDGSRAVGASAGVADAGSGTSLPPPPSDLAGGEQPGSANGDPPALGVPAPAVPVPGVPAVPSDSGVSGPVGSAPDPVPERPAGSAVVAHVAGDEVAVHQGPDGPVLARLPARTRHGQSTAFLVYGRGSGGAAGWLEVQLASRPNGSRGWVRRDDVDLYITDWLVAVDLSQRHLLAWEGDRLVLSVPVTVGAPATPTPTGTAFVTDVIRTPDPDGPYGPFVLGLSLHSEVLEQFAGGDGQIGLHGTDEPALGGTAASHGCVRLANGDLLRLAGAVPLGTPVLITP